MMEFDEDKIIKWMVEQEIPKDPGISIEILASRAMSVFEANSLDGELSSFFFDLSFEAKEKYSLYKQ